MNDDQSHKRGGDAVRRSDTRRAAIASHGSNRPRRMKREQQDSNWQGEAPPVVMPMVVSKRERDETRDDGAMRANGDAALIPDDRRWAATCENGRPGNHGARSAA